MANEWFSSKMGGVAQTNPATNDFRVAQIVGITQRAKRAEGDAKKKSTKSITDAKKKAYDDGLKMGALQSFLSSRATDPLNALDSAITPNLPSTY